MRTAHVESSHSSAPMADHCPVLELLAQLTATPVRRGGILDIPFDEYVEAVAWPEVGKLLGAYVHTQRRPTLRSVLIDPRQPRHATHAAGLAGQCLDECLSPSATGSVRDVDDEAHHRGARVDAHDAPLLGGEERRVVLEHVLGRAIGREEDKRGPTLALGIDLDTRALDGDPRAARSETERRALS